MRALGLFSRGSSWKRDSIAPSGLQMHYHLVKEICADSVSNTAKKGPRVSSLKRQEVLRSLNTFSALHENRSDSCRSSSMPRNIFRALVLRVKSGVFKDSRAPAYVIYILGAFGNSIQSPILDEQHNQYFPRKPKGYCATKIDPERTRRFPRNEFSEFLMNTQYSLR